MSTTSDVFKRMGEWLGNLTEEEIEQIRKDFQEFCDKRDREEREETYRYVHDSLLNNPSVSDATKQQVVRLIETLDTMPYITPTKDGGVSFEYQEVFCGHLYIRLNGSDNVWVRLSEPYPKTGYEEKWVHEADLQQAIDDLYAEWRVGVEEDTETDEKAADPA